VNLETRARAAAEGLRTATTVDTEAALAQLRRTHRRRSATRVAGVVGIAAAIALIVTNVALLQDRHTAEPAPAQSPSSTVSPSTAKEPIDTTTWTIYTSHQYGYKVGLPPNWVVISHASRDWRVGTDPSDPANRGVDTFGSPTDTVRVSVWKAPLDPGTSIDSTADIEAWVKDYCKGPVNSAPCSGINDRAVELCVEKWDCHPGLLVPFTYDTQAFFTHTAFNAEPEHAMTVVAVWVGESNPALAQYGGSQRLLEAFLSTMYVWPASTPRDERWTPGCRTAPGC
jgi:hypothetical protein